MKFHPAGKRTIRNTLFFVFAINLIAWLYLSVPHFNYLILLATILSLVAILQFFRYPDRPVTPNDNIILAPADGKICLIEECEETEYLKCICKKVSIFMSPLNVHINWIPVGGVITYLNHKEGKFYAAFKDKSAEENERTYAGIKLKDGREIVATQVAGAMARRILNFLKVGQEVTQGHEMGFIRFGSRVDLYLPLDTKINVKLGDKVTGTKTIIGELKV